MKISLLTLGTRGDVQPYAVLGQALQDRGHEVCLCTGKNFQNLVTSYGLNFIPLEADYQAILDTEEGQKILKANPFAIYRNLNQWIYPLISQSLEQFYQLAQESDKVIYHVKALADHFADQFPQKMIRAMVVPAVETTSAFANPAFSGFPFPRFLNRCSYALSRWAMRMMNKPIASFRSQAKLTKKYQIPHTPFLYGLSAYFLPRPVDFPKSSHFTGFWFENSSVDLPQDLLSFIQAGEPPLVISFGSMPFKAKLDLGSVLIRLTQRFGIRIILIRGWGLNQLEDLDSVAAIKVIDQAPYDKLFPLVKAIVHHGGLGTTAACLRAGKPFLVCPILYPVGDQAFWGQLAHQRGLAPLPLPLSQMTETKLNQRIEELLNQTALTQAAQALAALLQTENVLERAIQLIEA